MSSKFVISHLEVQMGPFDEAELKAKWAKGDLLPIDYVYDDVKQDWVLLAERFPWAVDEPEALAPPPLADSASRRAKKTETAAAAVAAQAAQIVMVDGQGEIELPGLQPGEVELALQNSGLQAQGTLKILIKSAEPKTIEWNLPTQQTVGDDVVIQVRALDGANSLCTNYEDTFTVNVNGGESEGNQIQVPLKNGHGTLRINHTKAESWRLSFHYSGARVLQLPSDRTLEWQPGPAVKLILDGPQVYTAGHPLKVSVKAVDKFGNLAKTYSGTLVLEVKAS